MSLHIFDNSFLISDMSLFISFKSVSFALHLSQMNINMDTSSFFLLHVIIPSNIFRRKVCDEYIIILEYAVQTWSPHQIGHIRLIEGVQRRFTRMIPELKRLSYEARLKRLNLTTLEIRRIRGDLIEVYKILNGLEKINPDSMFTRFTYNNTRCHTMKLEKKHVHLDSRKYFFTQRVIDYWNALPQTAIDAESINHFKDQLNVHLYNIIRGLNKPLAFSLSPTPH